LKFEILILKPRMDTDKRQKDGGKKINRREGLGESKWETLNFEQAADG